MPGRIPDGLLSPTIDPRRLWWVRICLFALGALAVATLAIEFLRAAGNGIDWWQVFGNPLTQLLILPLWSLLHAIGQLVCARFLGIIVLQARFGGGEPLWEGRILKTHWIAGRNPYSMSFVEILASPETTPRRSLALFWLAGPAVSASLTALFAFILVRRPFPGLAASDHAGLFPAFLFPWLVNLVYTILYLGPGAGISQLRRLLSDPDAVKQMLPAASPANRSTEWAACIATGQAAELLVSIPKILAKAHLSSPQRDAYLDAFASCTLMLGSREHLHTARAFAVEVLDHCPDDPGAKAGLGAILIELDEDDHGVRLMEDVHRSSPDPFLRGVAAAYLGFERMKRGCPAEGRAWFEKSKAADADCIPLKRFMAQFEAA
jgi:hypothetical protein